MSTKTKNRLARRNAKLVSKVAGAAPAAAVRSVVVHVHPKFAEFMSPDRQAVNGRVLNGSINSEAFVSLAKRLIAERDSGASVSLHFYDVQGREINASESEHAAHLS